MSVEVTFPVQQDFLEDLMLQNVLLLLSALSIVGSLWDKIIISCYCLENQIVECDKSGHCKFQTLSMKKGLKLGSPWKESIA